MSGSFSAARGVATLFALSGLLVAGQRLPARAQAATQAKKLVVTPNLDAAAPGDLAIINAAGQTVALCPLKHTYVNAEVSGFVSRVTVTQQFQNPSKSPIEAVYTFPLPADAAVDDMKMTLGDRTISGQVKRREEAQRIYEAARANGQAAALLDQERPNVFTQSVANVMPGQSVSVTLSYSNLLKYDDGQYEFTFPMVVGPRNVSQPSYDGAPGSPPVQSDGEKLTPPIAPRGTRAGHDISLNVQLDAGLPLLEVKSQLHEVAVERYGPNRARIRLRDAESIPNKDFILRYKVGGQQMQTGILAHSEGRGSGYFTLVLQPPAAPSKQDVAPKEMVFVIDQTGSQRGEPIKKAKETMRYCLENLNPGDTFQLIGFNTQIFPCFEEPVELSEESMKRALAFLEPLEGNGGTDILKSVDYALRIKDDPTRLRMICYMTDGFVGNDMQVLDHIRKNRGRARMFVFGIGNSVNRFLIDGMSREGRGASEIVDLKMPGEAAASRFHARIHQPILLDPQVDFGALSVEDVYPKAIPDVFSSGPIILKGRYKGAPSGEITVSGILRGKPWSEKVAVRFPAVQKENPALPTLWARAKLEDLQSQDWLGAQSGNPIAGIKEQVINLAIDYRLMSQYTSFVAVEDRIVNIGGKQRRVDVPVEMPEGVSHEGIFGGEAKLGEHAAGGVRTEGFRKQSDRFYLSAGAAVLTPVPPSKGFSLGFRGGSAASEPKPSNRGAAVGKPIYKSTASSAAGGISNTGNAVFDKKPGANGLVNATKSLSEPEVTFAQRTKQKSFTDSLERDRLDVAKRTGRETSKRETLKQQIEAMQPDEQILLRAKLTANPESVRNQLRSLKPSERRAFLRAIKMSPSLRYLPMLVKKEGVKGTLVKTGFPEVRHGRALVQIWVSGLSSTQARRLSALGFVKAGELKPQQLVLGTVPLGGLEKLAELDFVFYVETPKFLN